jgi:epsilon-lactone hydrolase
VSGDNGYPLTTNAARDVPVPSSISAEAQAILAMPRASPIDFPRLDDLAGWRRLIAAQDEAMASLLIGMVDEDAVDVERVPIGDGAAYKIVPAGCEKDSANAFLEIHGGGLIMGGGECCRITGAMMAVRLGMVTWSVDYRMPPDHPYPTPLDDCLAAYAGLVGEYGAGHVVVGGTSAGGNLAAATILRARDEGLPLPAAAVLLTPEVDLTESGDSFSTNIGLDNVLTQRQMPANLLYAGGHDLTLPYVSPLFGNFTKGFPPTFLRTGTRDLFLSNTVLMHRTLRKAGIRAELHVQEAGGHAGFYGLAPEDAEIDDELRRFLKAQWGRQEGGG